jgi:hypothetical protein
MDPEPGNPYGAVYKYLPSSNVELLQSLIGYRIASLVRHSWWSPEVVLEQLHVSPEMVFSLTLGRLLMQLDDGRVIGFGDHPPLNSVMVWLEREKESAGTTHVVGNSRPFRK